MKPLVVACLVTLCCGCSSAVTRSSSDSGSKAGYAKRTGAQASAWGELPTYEQQRPPIRTSARSVSAARNAQLNGVVTVELLVERDGTVRDVAIVETSGNPAVDHAAIMMVRAYQFRTKIHPDDSAPYLVPNIVVRFEGGEDRLSSPIDRATGG